MCGQKADTHLTLFSVKLDDMDEERDFPIAVKFTVDEYSNVEYDKCS